ncbi:DEAD/DEAH box helicase [Ruegeria marina]|nr:DEAD/DEAH box helicase [Ruegeria marina]
MTSPLFDALAERGFDTLTDVQQAVTAPELTEADLLVSAQTGSGKTVAFGLAIAPTLLREAERLDPPAAPLALIVAPTRELAMQVSRELIWLYARTGASVATCIGGMDARTERRALERGAHVVVGTPGRLRDHIERGALDLSDIRAVVLDEADEMLDLGFREDLEFMLGEAPEGRRTLMFSATVSPAIAELAKTYQREAVRVSTISAKSQHADIAYQAVQVAAHDAEHAIINLLRFHDAPTAIVFANTRAAVARLTARFANRGFAVVSLSGELSQDERSHALQAMRDGRARVCVATDVAARGIDLPNLDLVIHADLPINTEGLLHRSGRTGRAGRKGISALIVSDKIAKKAQRLLKWAKIEAEWTFAPTPEDILAKDEARLLDNPLWTAEVDEDESRFAAELMERFSAEQIAIACLRLHRAGLTAPEELNRAPMRADVRADPAASFGPSAWVALSVGRNQRAEPRWLLPLLCRAGNLEKSQIGKIRMQADETHVELAEAAVQGFLAHLGPNGVLEGEITAKAIEGVPADEPRQRAPKKRFDRDAERAPRPARKEPRPPREKTAEARDWSPEPVREQTPPPAPKPRLKPKSDKFADRKETVEAKPVAKKPFKSARPASSDAADSSRSFRATKPRGDKPFRAERSEGDKPARFKKPEGGKPSRPGKPGGEKPFRSGKPEGGKPTRFAKPDGDKPYRGSKPEGTKPARFAKPNAGKPAKPGARPAGKPATRGGDAPPRRKG